MRGVFKAGRRAVITGAAGGIGRAMACAFAAQGMRVALADLPGEALEAATTAARQASSGGETFAGPVDLGAPDAAESLREAALARRGGVEVLCANHVTREAKGFDAPLEAWRAAFEVNFWGVVETIRAFLPTLEAGQGPRALVTTGSKQGVANPPGHPIYNIAKAALKAHAEALEHELRGRPGNLSGPERLSTHLLIPGWTWVREGEAPEGAWTPDQVVAEMVAAVEADRFHVLCQDGETDLAKDRARIAWAAGDLADGRPPLSRWHPDWAQAAKDAGC